MENKVGMPAEGKQVITMNIRFYHIYRWKSFAHTTRHRRAWLFRLNCLSLPVPSLAVSSRFSTAASEHSCSGLLTLLIDCFQSALQKTT